MRLAVATNIPTPYRNPLFKEIAAQPDVQLRVFFCDKSEHDRQWEHQPIEGYEHEFCASIRVRKQRGVLYFSPAMIRQVRSFRPDAVIAGGLMIGLLARAAAHLSGAKFYVWSEATYDSDYAGRSRLSLRALRRLVRSADGCIASSTDTADYFRFLGAPDSRVATALMGVDTELFQCESTAREVLRAETRERLGLSGPTILYVGKLEEHKGIRGLLATYKLVLAEMPDCHLLLVGSGPLQSLVEDAVREDGMGNVRLVGFIQPRELPSYFYAADVFCLMSSREPFGAVVPEAMAAGLPCICSYHVGSARDLVVEGQNGFIVGPEDTADCAFKIGAVLSGEVDIQAMSDAARVAALKTAPKASALGMLSAVGWREPNGSAAVGARPA